MRPFPAPARIRFTGLMRDIGKIGREQASEWTRRSLEFALSPRGIKLGRNLLIAIVAFGLLGFFGVPVLTRYILTKKLPAALNRPVTVGDIGFNPYNLRMDISNLSIGQRAGAGQFANVGHLQVKVSWTSLLRFAPIIKELSIQQPTIHLARVAENRFNFSDLIEGSAPAESKPASTPSKPFRFAVSNIRIGDGTVFLDDEVVGQKHTVDKIQVGIPFIASLPSDADVFVQPLLQMVVDGSPFRIGGQAKPFGATRESIVNLEFDRLDLHRYVGYLPQSIPIKVLKGALSSDLHIHFVEKSSGPSVQTEGNLSLDDVSVADRADSPLFELKHANLVLSDVRPLDRIAHLSAIGVEGLSAHLVRNPAGTTNLSALFGPNASGPQTQSPAPAQQQTAPLPEATLDSFKLTDSAIELIDRSRPRPAAMTLQGIRFALDNFSTAGQTPASFDAEASLRGGGTVVAKGSLSLPEFRATTDISLDQVDLPALQEFAQSVLAAPIASGKFGARGSVAAHFKSGQFNVQAERASVSLDDFELRDPRGRESPVRLKHLGVLIGEFDLAAQRATVNEIRTDGLNLFVRRGHHGGLNLVSLMVSSKTPPTEKPRASSRRAKPKEQPSDANPPSQPWQYRIESIAIENTQAKFEDNKTPEQVALVAAPLNLVLKGVSSDFVKPFNVELDGTVNGKGTFKIAGQAAIEPLQADLKIETKKIDLSFIDPYLSGQLNATIASAALTMNGTATVSRARDQIRAGYRGDATLGNVQLLDKLTLDNFAKWRSLSAKGINAEYGAGVPKVQVTALSLSNFYSRIILNRNGKLNLTDITTSPQSAPTSLTLVQPTSPALSPTPTPAVSTSNPASGQPSPANIEIVKTILQGGKVNYTDNFIQPNYTANLTEIGGSIGAVGTASTQPAAVLLEGRIDGSAPLNINGSVNPLAPMAFVDLKAKADGIELTHLTPYSTKYTGYPIVEGTMTLDVHYLLEQQKLTADNHIFIARLTFGDHVDNASATNLPVRLAVAILKDSRGQIDVNIPIAGSLSDPQFSLGRIILQAVMNLIAKAVTSPFALLGSAFGGNAEDLGYIEFTPGYATITADSQNKLATVTKVLQDRTALRLGISGRVDPQFDTEGLRDAMVMQQIRAQKIKDLGARAAGIDPNSIQISNDEYDKYLERAYKAAKFPKPTDFVGLTKSLPPDEMKKLMRTNTQVDDKALAKLADARANAVRQALSKQIDPARLLVTAPKLNADGIKDKGKTTRADLSLQ
jgi:uncharacterized protein involved in outer membrane biogenesis